MQDFSGAVEDFTDALHALRDNSTLKVNALIRRAHCFLFLVSFQLRTRPCRYKIFILNWLGLNYRNEFSSLPSERKRSYLLILYINPYWLLKLRFHTSNDQ